MKCFVPSCSSDFHHIQPVERYSKHRFPDSLDRRILWLQAIANATNEEFNTSQINFNVVRICSKHFHPNCFYALGNRRRIVKTAIPTIFGNQPCIESEFLISDILAGDDTIAEEDLVQWEYEFLTDFNVEGEKVFDWLPGSQSSPIVEQRECILVRPKTFETPVNLDKVCQQAKRKRGIRYAGDLKEADVSIEEAAVALPKVCAQLQRTQKTVKRLRSQNKRLRDKLQTMDELLRNMRGKQLIPEKSDISLQEFSADDNLFRELRHRKKGQPCSEALRRFATTLHFHSAQAYRYVRKVFRKTLPHERTIIRWYVSVDGDPGITAESLAVLEEKSRDSTAKGIPCLACLEMDEMAIKQQIEWNEHTEQLEGIVQPSTSKQSSSVNIEQVPAAKEALVFMVTGVQDSWKLPVAYFLIAGMNAEDKKNAINTVLANLHEVGVTVIAFTFDGTKTNIATANLLGCNLKTNTPDSLVTSFKHPCSNHDMYAILDVVHMAKLVRNTLHSQKEFHTPSGIAKWNHIKQLNEFQNTTGVRLATRLSDKHIYFDNSKMKVILAVQVLSNSVASALGHLRSTNDEFADCAGTAEFLHIFNDMFDVFNSMHPGAQGFKKPLSEANFDLYRHAFLYVEDYIRKITLKNGTLILDSRNKTGFLGFLVAIQSFSEIYRIYCEENNYIDELFTYRFSQDHLEMFFGAARSKGGCNNNPNAAQFKAIYKRLITNNDITVSAKANCSNFENTKLLFTSEKRVNEQPEQSTMVELQFNLTKENQNLSINDNEFMDDSFIHAAMTNYAAEVHKKLVASLKCSSCKQLIITDNSFITNICKIAELEFKSLDGDKHDVNVGKYFDLLVANALLRTQTCLKSMFETVKTNENCGTDHQIELVKRSIIAYLNIRIKLYSKQMIPFKAPIRQKLTKLIIFEGN